MPQPSFTLAPGDPGALFAAADWHDHVAAGLGQHAGTIRAAAGSVSAVWEGSAASAYQALAGAMAFGFEVASTQSGDAASIYRRVAAEVERCQDEGRIALRQAEHWCDEVIQDQRRVTTTQAAIITAQQDVQNAEHEVAIAAASPDANGAARIGGARANLTAALDRLHDAQGQLRTAQHDLDHANQELQRWDRRGEQLFQEAEQAVEHLTGLALSVAPPPMPGSLAGIDALSTAPPASLQHHGGGFWHDVLNVVHTGANVVSAVGGACSSTLFWVPDVGEGCGIAAGAGSLVSAATSVTQAATGNGSLAAAAVDGATAVGGVGLGLKLGREGDELLKAADAAKGSAGAVLRNKGMAYKGAASAVDGAAGTWSAGSVAASAGHH